MKSYIWTLPTRVFHWLFASFMLIVFLTDDDKLLKYHAVIGYAILVLIIFRLFWGYFGPKYSKFKDFTANKKSIKDFIKNIFNKNQNYVGHNPLASLVMLGMFIVSLLAIFTGIVVYGAEEHKGILSFLNSSFFKSFDDIHEFFANFIIFLVVLHLIGIFIDKTLHAKNETVNSIFTGYKKFDTKEDIRLNIFQKGLALVFFITLIIFTIYNFTSNSIFIT